MSKKVLILLGSSSDLKITEAGLGKLRESGTGFDLRISSAHRTPERVHELVTEFEKQGGQLVICVAGMSAHLAGVVAALTLKPVIAVPVDRPATAGFDALLSMGQMPAGIPVATMGLGKSGFTNGCILALQVLALSDPKIDEHVRGDRLKMAEKVYKDDEANQVSFAGT